MDLPGLTALLTYRLTGPADDFARAAGLLAARVRAEGDTGVLTYRFYLDHTSSSARAVVDYRDPAAWIGHHQIITGWPEMAALRNAATLTGITFLGNVTEDILQWLARCGLTAQVDHGADLVAGFVRG